MKKYNPRSKYNNSDDDEKVVSPTEGGTEIEELQLDNDLSLPETKEDFEKVFQNNTPAPVENTGAELVEETSTNDSVYTIARNKMTGRVEVVSGRSEAEMNMIVDALHNAMKPRKIEMSKNDIEEVKSKPTIITEELKKDEPTLFTEQLRLTEKAIQSLEIELEIMKEVYELEPDEQQRRFHNTRMTQLKTDISNQNRRKNAILNIIERKGFKIESVKPNGRR